MKVVLITEKQYRLIKFQLNESKNKKPWVLSENIFHEVREVINAIINAEPLRLFDYKQGDPLIYKFLLFLANMGILMNVMGDLILFKGKNFNEGSILLKKHLLQLFKKFRKDNV